jgi:CMP-N-acetylneuraminic acid synthetase
MLKNKALIGNNPGFISLNAIESMDINTLEEFELAEIIFKEGLAKKLF